LSHIHRKTNMDLLNDFIAWLEHFGPGTFDSLLTLGGAAAFCALARVIYVPETVFRRRLLILFGNSLVGLVVGKIAVGIEFSSKFAHFISAIMGFVGDKLVSALVKKGSQIEQNPNRAKDFWK
jgi:Phage holin family (Lysis protein S)